MIHRNKHNCSTTVMSHDIAEIATFGKWSSRCGGIFCFLSAVSFFPLFFDFDSNGGITYLCWLLVALSYLFCTIAYKHVARACGTTTEVFYADLAATIATIYACYECAVYYLQLTYLRRTSDPIGVSLVRDEPGSPIFALDLFGYFLLSVSTIFLAMTMSNMDQKFLKYLLFFHGYSGVTCVAVPALPMMYEYGNEDDITWQLVLLFWCAQFTPICFLLSKYFDGIQGKDKQK